MKIQTHDGIFGRPLPQAIDAERAVLGSILHNEEAFQRIAAIVAPADFFSPAHRTILAAMVHLSEQQRPIDVLTLKDELRQRGGLDEVGGSAYVSGLVDDIPDVANVESYARTVKEKSQGRELVRIGTDSVRRALDGERPMALAADLAEGLQLIQPIDAMRAVLPFGQIEERWRSTNRED